MNRLYLLGAIALSQVSAYVALSGTTIASAISTLGNTVYTGSATDCFSTGTATTLGMNNIYYQYYSFSVSAGTTTYSTTTSIDGTTIATSVVSNSVNGCTHEHLYNWMAQPQLASSGVTDGISDALVAYGYMMEGSTLAACALKISAVTTTLYSSSTFTGGRFQYVNAILTGNAVSPETTIATPVLNTMLTHYGNGALLSNPGTVQAYSPSSADGVVVASSNNLYYDFAQQQVVQGQTQFGRGGGASTAPCGWWVFYAHEGGVYDVSGSTPVTDYNVANSWASVTVHMWTDNAIVNTIGAFTLAALAALY